ncbi:SAM-dependent methyltransferase [Croceicoccus sp. BE223]|uniref:class I SAM-dependent methyltransferase n=1 Tax=Croceicoccus sp. BE223 TaxID=2817716 RepID=UPI00285C9EAE|nr:SAM-dependent methyltransferase [Croceicoccus sp. BE223]MDR7101945.1 NADH dehydrogenase [ubiquinone] 1 alpha subcomplex assembly factor 7 [Croceicoccus sp. BE223]
MPRPATTPDRTPVEANRQDGDEGDLGAHFQRLIRRFGPIPLGQYMAEANARYYAVRDPLGAAGDFVTAPEVSQMFGEMIGGWLADLRARAGRMDSAYVELGPGRGTLARDSLRVLARAAGRPDVHLVEGSPVLRAAQSALLGAVTHHDDIDTLPDDRPLLVVANEFFDALPIRQLVKTAQGWRERMVGLAGDVLVPVAGDRPMDAAVPADLADAPDGALIETCPAASAIMAALAERVAAQGGAILAIDYGYEVLRHGSTFQAVARHQRTDPFAAPGTADLTAHVDFGALASAARHGGLVVDGVAGQGDFLLSLGIGQRAAALARANPAQAESLATALHRLVDPAEMGTLFRVLAARSAAWPQSSGFAHAESG